MLSKPRSEIADRKKLLLNYVAYEFAEALSKFDTTLLFCVCRMNALIVEFSVFKSVSNSFEVDQMSGN